jgi:hypothetical protein
VKICGKLIIFLFNSAKIGESVPQMKEALSYHSITSSGNDEDIMCNKEISNESSSYEEKLDMQGAHRVHTLFSGSSIVTVDNGFNRNATTERSYCLIENFN